MEPQALQALFSAGPYGLCAILALVIVFLYRGSIAKDEKIAELNEKRVEVAVRVETVLASTKDAITNLTAAVKETAEASDDRFETIRAVQAQAVQIGQIVGANGGKLETIEKELLRELIQRGRP